VATLTGRPVPNGFDELIEVISRVGYLHVLDRSPFRRRARAAAQTCSTWAGRQTSKHDDSKSATASANSAMSLEGLPAFDDLPFIRHENQLYEPRIYLIAAYYVGEVRGELSLLTLRPLIARIQSRVLLSIFELRLLAFAIRIEVLHLLSAICKDAVSDIRAARVEQLLQALEIVSDPAWKHIAAGMCKFERILKQDVSQAYSSMDGYAKEAYRTAVGRLARRLSVTEVQVATQAHAMAEEAAQYRGIGPMQHIGFYLVDRDGVRMLAHRFNPEKVYSPAESTWFAKNGPRMFAVLVLTTSAVVASFPMLVDDRRVTPIGIGDTGALFIACFVVILMTVQTLGVYLVPPERILSMDPAIIDNEAKKALVVIPCLVRERKDVYRLCKILSSHASTSEYRAAGYALLSDFRDAPEATQPEDRELLLALQEGVEALNVACGSGNFLLLHRNRTYSEAQQCWMGKERKRGKIEDLVELLVTGTSTFAATAGDLGCLAGVEFVLTLDEDCSMSERCLQRLVAVAQHPLNKPSPMARDGFTSSGYGILQPRVTHSAEHHYTERFTFRSAKPPRSTLNATHAFSNVYQDAFGISHFMGKGLIHVSTYFRTLHHRLPDDFILSHDVVESGYIRTAFVSHVAIEEGRPANEISFVLRSHRWIRGDWQNLIWLGRSMVDRKKALGPLRMTFFGKWMIVEKALKTLIEPTLMYLLFRSIWASTRGAIRIGWLIYILLMLGPMLHLLFRQVQRRRTLGALFKILFQEHASAFIRLCMVGRHSVVTLHAIGVTIARAFSGRRVLEWTTSQSFDLTARVVTPTVYEFVAIQLGLILAATVYALFNPSHRLSVGGFALLLSVGPAIPWLRERASVPKSVAS